MRENKNWKWNFLTIAVGQTISLIGSSAVQFALIWWIAKETDSPLMLGLSGLAAYLPILFLSPFAGILADKVDRKVICITADLFMGISAAAFAVFMWNREVSSQAAIFVLFLRGIAGTFHQPSIQAIIPQLVPSEKLLKANGWSQFMQSGAFMIGPVLGAAMYAALPLPVILLTDLVGAIAASVMLGVVKIPRLHVKSQEKRKMIHELKEGIQVYLEDRKLLTVMAAETACMLFFLPLSSFYPLMTSGYFGASAWHASAVELAFALGMMAAAFLMGSIIPVKNKINTVYLGLFGIGITSFLCGILPPAMWAWWIFMISCGFMGAFGNVHSIPLVAYMQETIAPEKMGRAFSIMGMTGSLTMPLGLMIGGPVAEAIGVHMWFLVTGIAVCLVVVITLWMTYRPSKKESGK